MIRFQIPLIACFVILNCAHDVTQPLADAPALVEAVTGQNECPDVLQLGPIGDPAEFVAAMHGCEDQSVVVEINSPGGSIFGALEIQKAIERHPRPVICVVDGLAASAAFITLQSCDIRTMTSRSVLMAHHASAAQRGQSQEQQNLADALRTLDRAQALWCAKRMGMSPDAYAARTAGGREWWMGLEDALKYHAVDFQVEDIREAVRLARSGSMDGGR